MALFKHFAIKERLSFEFRAEAFNVFNHTQWGYIGGGGGSAANNSAISSFTNSVGCNNSQADFTCSGLGFLSPNGAHNPRILQLGLKLIF
jgi:hypothetical protein